MVLLGPNRTTLERGWMIQHRSRRGHLGVVDVVCCFDMNNEHWLLLVCFNHAVFHLFFHVPMSQCSCVSQSRSRETLSHCTALTNLVGVTSGPTFPKMCCLGGMVGMVSMLLGCSQHSINTAKTKGMGEDPWICPLSGVFIEPDDTCIMNMQQV